eukprot:CAMPEP_0181454324 /NCGR_PEP_ID=MMETSP1110-20121109/30179_1 /TAXON_ID=174948 /ORGANISM="Symbiodinium sp., Strain CCMP421" /LENGTH=159 /DNA_ID=CAMNT_0023578665 /DNA_START=61 /DNA_END=540 /DNA_ORIENTATION=-
MALSTKMMVGVSIKDIQGATRAVRKAIDLAQPGDKIVALNIPKLVPEMMLSSMNDPGDATEETFAALANLPSRAGANMQAQIKEAAEAEMKKLGKEIAIDYKVTQPSGDVKSGLLAACKAEGASMLFLGPGVGGNGSIPPFAVAHAKGLTVCIVRDHIE